MSEPEFPPELVEAIRERAQRHTTPFQYVYPSVVSAVLLESGHAELVAALLDAKGYVYDEAMHGKVSAKTVMARIDNALRKAGAL